MSPLAAVLELTNTQIIRMILIPRWNSKYPVVVIVIMIYTTSTLVVVVVVVVDVVVVL